MRRWIQNQRKNRRPAMTLNITLVSREAIYQSSDFRLSVFDTATGRYIPRDDVAQKQVFVSTFRWNATVTFTGVGATADIRVADWLAEQVRSFKGHVPFSDLLKALLGADSWLRTVPARDRRHTFVVAGFVSIYPIVALVSNFETVTAQAHPDPLKRLIVTQFRPRKPQLIITGQRAAVETTNRASLLRRVRAGAAAHEMHLQLAETNAVAARRPAARNTVSEACFTCHLSSDGTGEARAHGLDESQPYTPAFADMLSQLGLRLRPALDEQGRPKPIQFRGMTFARSEPTERFHREQLRRKPNDPSTHNNYGAYLIDIAKDVNGAEAAYRRALELDPEHSLALGNLANLTWRHRNDISTTEALYRKAIDADARNANARINYAGFLREVRRDQDASERLYKEGLEADPKNEGLLRAYSAFLYNEGRLTESAAVFERYAEARPRDPDALADLAAIRTVNGDVSQDTVDLYRRALRENPNHALALANLAQLLHLQGDHDEAEQLASRSLVGQPTDATQLEVWFYRYAHGTWDRENALNEVLALLQRGVRSPGWDLSRTVQVAAADHPAPEYLNELGNVITCKADISDLPTR